MISRIEAKDGTDKIIGTRKVLVPKAVKNGEVIQDDLITVNLKVEVDDKKCTKEGDIILKLSQPYDAAYITKQDEGIIVTSFCLILRNVSKDIKPEYLITFLNSSLYKEQAMRITSGATIPMLTKGKIQQIELEKFGTDEQEQIIVLNQDIQKKQKLFDEIIKLEKMKLENLLRGEN